MTISPSAAVKEAGTSPSPWAQSGWLSTEITPFSNSPTLWNTPNHNHNNSSDGNAHRTTTDADELLSNLVLPPPPCSPLHSPLPRNTNNHHNHTYLVSPLHDFSESVKSSSSSPSNITTQPFITLPVAQASKCAFPPSCPVLTFNKDTCAVEVGLVKAVVLDLIPQPSSSSSTSGLLYDIENFTGASRVRVAEKDLQFAPHCPVWFQSLHDSGSQASATVLASYHSPHMNETTDCYYSVLVDAPIPMIHHGVRLPQLSYRPPAFTAATTTTPMSLISKPNNAAAAAALNEAPHYKGDRSVSVPSEVVTSTTQSDVSSTGSFSEPVTPRSIVDFASPPGFKDDANKKLFSAKIHLPTWIADMNDLENDFLEPEAKFLRRVEEKTNCLLEVEQLPSTEDNDGNHRPPVVTVFSDDAARLAGARTYVENFIIDRVHERLEGRLLYHFAIDQLGDAYASGWQIVRQRAPENRKTEVWMTAIHLPSEDCIRAVIGKGGRFINFLRSITGCAVTLESRVEITTEPFVYICSTDRGKVEEAAALVDEKIQGKLYNSNNTPSPKQSTYD